ncbi:hypothetical protein TNCV_3884571 [Trichonephila clavipes]|nr:hypothetical protein TNCV_3884571 [Trichonephila clavipes]
MDGRKTYRNCDNSLDTELTPAHIFHLPAILAALQKVMVLFSSAYLCRLLEHSSEPMVLSDLVPPWIRHHHHQEKQLYPEQWELL